MESNTTSEGSILIAHIGDIHLRDTQYATSQRSGDFFNALMRAINAAADDQVDVIVCCGDNFDVSRPSAKVIGQLMQADALLKERNMRMLTITGNHDYSSPTWLSTLFPGNVGKQCGIVPMDGATIDIKGFKITGVPPYTARTFKEKEAEIDILVRDSDVVLYHGFVTGIVPAYTGDKAVLDVADMPKSPSIKAVLLADIHTQGYVQTDRPGGGKTLVGYPGSLEMCSKSESKDKSLPVIRLQSDCAIVDHYIPLTIRPHISKVVKNDEELNQLMVEVQEEAPRNPVVLVDFSRSVPQTVSRLHAALDPQRSVVRCYALPADIVSAPRTEMAEEEEELDMRHFVSRRFDDNAELCALAIALLDRGDVDGNNIVSQFVEMRLATAGVREEVLS